MTYKTRTATALLSAGFIAWASAATISTATFTSTTTAVDLTSAEDWGYLDGALFGSNGASGNSYTYDGTTFDGGTVQSNRHSSGSMGAVTLLETGILGVKNDTNFEYTFSNGTVPTSDTGLVTRAGGYGDHRVEDLFTFTFNDVGAGDHVLDIYHSTGRGNQTIDFTTNISATDGNIVDSVFTGSHSAAGSYVYSLAFSTSDASADVTINWNATAEDGGSDTLGAFVLNTTAIPEPSTTALLGLGGFALILRRRK